MNSQQRAELPGSALKQRPGDKWIGPADPLQELTVTIMLRGPASKPDIAEALLSGTYKPPSREAAEAALAADPKDMQAVASFARDYGLTIVSEDRASRTLRLSGTVQNLESAFGVQIGWVQDATGDRYLTYRGTVTLPESVAPAITAVLGLDKRPVAKQRDSA